MPSLLSVRLRTHALLVCGVLLLACAAPVAADPKPLTKEEQAKVDAAIDKGVAFLKKAQTKEGDFNWKLYSVNLHQVAQCALPAYALLESGVLADDPVIQKAAAYLRPRVLLNSHTYDLSLAILFFDRLGDPKDKALIQICALRLIAGQHRTGGWAYRCPILSDKDALDLLKGLGELGKRREEGEKTRSQALEGLELPPAMQALTVFQDARRLPWQEPAALASETSSDTFRTASLADRATDNSNTQFALLGLWAARRHQMPVESTLEICVERFERFQNYPFGFWSYAFNHESFGTARKSMTCVGLIGLAIGRGLNLPTPGSPTDDAKDVHVLRGLLFLSRQIGKPRGDMNKRVDLEDLYFLWTLERAATLFNLPDIGGKDWYRWGVEGLVTNQKKDGWWPDASPEKRVPQITYKATLCTSFALLFLKRSHPMKDLTPKLPFTAKELNEGIVSLRPKDNFPFQRGVTSGRGKNLKRGVTAPSESRRR